MVKKCDSCTQFKCGDGQCTLKQWKCNRVKDCIDGSDEVVINFLLTEREVCSLYREISDRGLFYADRARRTRFVQKDRGPIFLCIYRASEVNKKLNRAFIGIYILGFKLIKRRFISRRDAPACMHVPIASGCWIITCTYIAYIFYQSYPFILYYLEIRTIQVILWYLININL